MSTTRSEDPRSLVISISVGIDDELSTVAFTLANGGITSGLEVSVFLTSSGVDLVRKGAVDMTEVHPFETLRGLMTEFVSRGGNLWACAPCVKGRGYTEKDLVEGTIITGASVVFDQIQGGAATLSF